MMRRKHTLKTLPPTLMVLALALAPTIGMAQDDDDDDDEKEFDEAHLFFELNDTDGDLGIHAKIDGDPWKRLEIENPDERRIFSVRSYSKLKKQGLTEILFESHEPTFDELHPKDFFKRFPEGIYDIEADTLDGEELESEVELTHVMPAAPQPTVNGQLFSEHCDDEEPGFAPTPVTPPVVIAWPQVTMSHPDPDGGGAGVQPPVGIEVHNYEVVVEFETDDEFESVMSVVLPPGETSIRVPDSLLALADEFKYEVLVREKTFNQTATESCFVVQ